MNQSKKCRNLKPTRTLIPSWSYNKHAMKHSIYSIILFLTLYEQFTLVVAYIDTGWLMQHTPATLRRRLGHTSLVPSPPTSLAVPEESIADSKQCTRSDADREPEESCQHPFWQNTDEYGFERDLFDDILVDNQERQRLADSLV